MEPKIAIPASMLVDKPMSVVLQSDALEEAALSAEVQWVAQRMKLIRKNLVFGTKQAQIVAGFLRSTSNGRLFSLADEHYMLHCNTSFPQRWEEIFVLLRNPEEELDATNINKKVQCLLIRGSPSEGLLRILQEVYVPLMLHNESWQISVTKDFKEDLDKFLTTLTESIYEAKGQTLLYLPALELTGSPAVLAKNKELTQRLESILIRWTRQIKEVVRSQEAYVEDDSTGPLAEIAFWRKRNINLGGLRDQMSHQVCDAQSQFSRNLKLPAFGGSRGLELTKSLTDSQETFHKLVNSLRGLSYNLLDVKVTSWHDDFHDFKEGVTDLEVMMQNTMVMGFRHASSLSESIELLEAFKLMACRAPIRLCVEKMTEQVFETFGAELAMLKKQFDQLRRRPLMDFSFPQYAGSAIWSLHFDRRLKKPMALLLEAAPYLLEDYDRPDLTIQYNHIVTSIDQFVHSQHAEWIQSGDPHYTKKLEKNLLDEAGEGVVVLKFDPSLFTLFHELLAGMDPTMRGLVSDRVLQLDNSIHPGLDKLTWLSTSDELLNFLHDVRVKCHVVEATILQIEGSNKRITQYCVTISESWLIKMEKKKVYDISDFEAKQGSHRETARERLQKTYNTIKDTIATSYEKCASESDDVRSKWEEYRRKVEVEMEKALRSSVMRSLQELSRALSTEAKMLNPVFNTLASLDKPSGHVKISPSVQEILDIVQVVARELVSTISVVPRLRTQAGLIIDSKTGKLHAPSVSSDKTTSSSDKSQMKHPKSDHTQPHSSTSSVKGDAKLPLAPTPTSTTSSTSKLPSFYEVIAPDQEEIITVITSAVLSVNDKVQQFLQSWEKKFKSVWDQDKDAYIRRYERAKKPLSAFEADIVKYKDLIEDVQSEETITNLRFLRIDCGLLKQSIITHCEAWVVKFTTLLNQIAKTELEAIHSYLQKAATMLNIPPENLDMLTATATEWKAVKEEGPAFEARFSPLDDKYKVLAKFEVPIADEEKSLLESVPGKWEEFNIMLANVEQKLEAAKNNFRDTLSKMVDSFVAEISEARASFVERMPMTTATSVVDAFKFIEEERAKVQVNQQRGVDLWAGMSLFGMEKLSNKENTQTLKDLELLQNMWGLMREWQEHFDSWKDGLFSELDVPSMENVAQTLSKRVFKIGRDTKT